MLRVDRATSETMRLQATQEGLVPLKTSVKSALDRVIQDCMGETGLEFAIAPLQLAPATPRISGPLEQNKNFCLTSHSACGIVTYNGDGAGGRNAAAPSPALSSISSSAPAPAGGVRAPLITEPQCPLSTCSYRS